jgi:hypothetical protein
VSKNLCLSLSEVFFSKELKALRAKCRHLRTAAEKRKIDHLPQTLLIIDEQINKLVDELGGDHYRDMPGATSELHNLFDPGFYWSLLSYANSSP